MQQEQTNNSISISIASMNTSSHYFCAILQRYELKPMLPSPPPTDAVDSHNYNGNASS